MINYAMVVKKSNIMIEIRQVTSLERPALSTDQLFLALESITTQPE